MLAYKGILNNIIFQRAKNNLHFRLKVGAYGQGVSMAAGMPGQPAPVSGVAPVVAGAVPPAVNTEWAVPQPTRAKYSATFYQTDRARTGFLAGNQVLMRTISMLLSNNYI